MAAIMSDATVNFSANISLTEPELRALCELAAYGPDKVIELIGEQLSPKLAKDHKAGFTSFLKTVREIGPDIILRINNARMVLSGAYDAVPVKKHAPPTTSTHLERT